MLALMADRHDTIFRFVAIDPVRLGSKRGDVE
jgi:hypothetical protein